MTSGLSFLVVPPGLVHPSKIVTFHRLSFARQVIQVLPVSTIDFWGLENRSHRDNFLTQQGATRMLK